MKENSCQALGVRTYRETDLSAGLDRTAANLRLVAISQEIGWQSVDVGKPPRVLVVGRLPHAFDNDSYGVSAVQHCVIGKLC